MSNKSDTAVDEVKGEWKVGEWMDGIGGGKERSRDGGMMGNRQGLRLNKGGTRLKCGRGQ